MRSTLVLGATGAVGGFLLPQLRARGERIFALSRQPRADTERIGGDILWLRGDLFGAMPAMPAVGTIYSLGPLDAFAAWYARAAPAGVARVIALGSMSADSKRDSLDVAERELAARLREAERTLFEAARRHGSDCTILRPTLIYGAGRDASLAPLARFARRWRVLPVPRRARGLRQPVHAADLAQACVAVRDCAAAHGKVYALGGGERLRFDAMLRRLAQAQAAWPLALPRAIVRLLARGRVGALARLDIDLIADPAPAERDFGYAPRGFIAADALGPREPELPER